MSHTPTPWALFIPDDDDFDYDIIEITTHERDGLIPIAAISTDFADPIGGEQKANAAFIIRAVNSHDDLVAALHAVTDAYWGVDNDDAGDDGEPPSMIIQARAALSKAKAAS